MVPEIAYLIKFKLSNALFTVFSHGLIQPAVGPAVTCADFIRECATVPNAFSQVYAHLMLPTFMDTMASIQQRDRHASKPENAVRVFVSFFLK